ncbi:MAG: adenylate/guanylate cyclase domain-containing protein, partial [Lachnospiraceae bacterium]|nr:adenylate/guanylate cyclase domain-containing protein [Lachnospiraceae bacterium]
LIAALFALLLRKKGPSVIVIVSLVISAVYLLVGRFLAGKGVYIQCAYVILFLILADIYFIFEKYVVERIRRRHTLDVFKKYVAPQVVDELSHTGDFELHLGGEKRDIAVLFVDIRGFTSMSELLEPEQVVEILNEYLKHVTDCVLSHNGTLDKFIGDAAMAIFNAPFDLDDYVYQAVATAWDISRGAEKLEKQLEEKFGRTIKFGVGVNCGPAIVGNIGCDFRMDYTAIGDTVNTSARLESNAKAGQILISEDVYNKLKGRIEAESVGEIPLKGKSNKIEIFSVVKLNKEEGTNNEGTMVDNT